MMEESVIKYSLEAFTHNVDNKLCRYIGGGLSGSETLCTEPVHENNSYCKLHDQLCHRKSNSFKMPDIKE